MEILNTPTEEQINKYNHLLEYLKSLESVAIAFSSGVDSTFLLFAAKEALGDKMMAVTAVTSSFPQREKNEAVDFCEKYNIYHELCNIDVMKIEGFTQNPPNRCYICKRAIFENIIDVANSNNIQAIAEGSNLDDNGDYRPGLLAIAELGVKSPLREAGLTKYDIRVLSKFLNLPTWEKPSYACLATRFVYGETISEEKLAMVDKGEQLLIDLGFHQMRVRIHDRMARIEVLPEEFVKLLDDNIRLKIVNAFKEYGFDYVSMDLVGYRTGSMNEVLDK